MSELGPDQMIVMMKDQLQDLQAVQGCVKRILEAALPCLFSTALKKDQVYFNAYLPGLLPPRNQPTHGLRTSNEGIKQRNLEIWANVADKICFGRTKKFGSCITCT